MCGKVPNNDISEMLRRRPVDAVDLPGLEMEQRELDEEYTKMKHERERDKKLHANQTENAESHGTPDDDPYPRLLSRLRIPCVTITRL